jgi:hypothetical protein
MCGKRICDDFTRDDFTRDRFRSELLGESAYNVSRQPLSDSLSYHFACAENTFACYYG